MKNLLVLLISLPSTFIANAQNAPVQAKFEVASVKRTDQCEFKTSFDPASVVLKGVPLKAVLMEAFQVKMDQIEGPGWLETDCYEIVGKMPEGSGRDQLPAMLRALLTERLKLTAHEEDRPRKGYALVVDKGGLKCKEDDPSANFMGGGRAGMILIGRAGIGRLKGVMTMAALANSLAVRGYGPGLDLTGLTGKYDIDLSWTPDPLIEPGVRAGDPAASAADPGPELATALRQSLGLRMERHDQPVKFVVIEHIEKVPTEN